MAHSQLNRDKLLYGTPTIHRPLRTRGDSSASPPLAIGWKHIEKVEHLVLVHDADLCLARFAAHGVQEGGAVAGRRRRVPQPLSALHLAVLHKHGTVLVQESVVPLAVDAQQTEATWAAQDSIRCCPRSLHRRTIALEPLGFHPGRLARRGIVVVCVP